MAKCVFHPNIQGYSGTIINLTHAFRTRVKWVSNNSVGGFVKPKTKYSPNDNFGLPKTWAAQCMQSAFKLVTQDWVSVMLNPANYTAWTTWRDQAAIFSALCDYNISVYQFYVATMLEVYALQNQGSPTTWFFPTSILAGTSYNYDDAATRLFI